MSNVTIGHLGLRKFDKGTSSKVNCPVAATITMDDYLSSKACGDNNSIVPYSGHQIITAINHYVHQYIPDQNRKWSAVHVYRDHMRYDGYVERHTPETSNMPLLTSETPIKDLVFQRVIGRMDLIGDDHYKASLAFRYEPKFIEIAIGFNVTVCQNFNIFGGTRFVSDRGFPYEKMIAHIAEIIANIEDKYGHDLAVMKQLQDTPLNTQRVNLLLGEMLQMYDRGNSVIPITDITALSRQIVMKEKSEVPTETMWDFVQRGTEILRFDNNAGEAILKNIDNFNNYTATVSQKLLSSGR